MARVLPLYWRWYLRLMIVMSLKHIMITVSISTFLVTDDYLTVKKVKEEMHASKLFSSSEREVSNSFF